jgi:hypothetical protein
MACRVRRISSRVIGFVLDTVFLCRDSQAEHWLTPFDPNYG